MGLYFILYSIERSRELSVNDLDVPVPLRFFEYQTVLMFELSPSPLICGRHWSTVITAVRSRHGRLCCAIASEVVNVLRCSGIISYVNRWAATRPKPTIPAQFVRTWFDRNENDWKAALCLTSGSLGIGKHVVCHWKKRVSCGWVCSVWSKDKNTHTHKFPSGPEIAMLKKSDQGGPKWEKRRGHRQGFADCMRFSGSGSPRETMVDSSESHNQTKDD